MKFLLPLFFIFSTSLAFGHEYFVCNENGKPRAFQGDCKNLGLCSGSNDTGLKVNCFEATKKELDKARTDFVKYDPSIIEGSRIVDFTQEEKDSEIAKRAKAIKDAQDASIDALNISTKDLIQALIDLKVIKDAQEFKDTIKNYHP